jgi:hypothetical protein
MKWEKFVGRPMDSLSVAERWQLAGKWAATQLYSPETLPLRIIAAVGDSARDCATQLRDKGADPKEYEFLALPQPYHP